MEVLLLGTAAAEGWPCPWCACPACRDARRRGGRDLRTRSGALIDDAVKVDHGPDTAMQMLRAGRDLTRLTTLVFTHGHDDHFTPKELQYRASCFVTQGGLPTLHVYASALVLDRLRAALGGDLPDLALELRPPLEAFQSVTTPDGTAILPLPAAHAPGSFLLKITRRGRSLLYGHDTGRLPDETVAALADAPLDLALFDCTYGPQPREPKGHMGVDAVIETAERLRAAGAVTDATRLVATHFSHNGGLNHDGLTARLSPHGIGTAYDGMLIDC